jgi:crotonobetainyl-CoA:carnitine CoA-transferase CaiB-like acyl-CoA transferase
VENRSRVVSAISRRVKSENAQHWIDGLEAVGVPCGLVKGVTEALHGIAASPVTGMPPSVPGSVRLRPPKLDEQGEAIRERGWGVFA